MSPLLSILLDVAHFVVFSLGMWAIQKGIITPEHFSAAASILVYGLFTILLGGAMALSQFGLKWIHGLFPNSPYFPSNIPGVQIPTKELSADDSPLPKALEAVSNSTPTKGTHETT